MKIESWTERQTDIQTPLIFWHRSWPRSPGCCPTCFLWSTSRWRAQCTPPSPWPASAASPSSPPSLRSRSVHPIIGQIIQCHTLSYFPNFQSQARTIPISRLFSVMFVCFVLHPVSSRGEGYLGSILSPQEVKIRLWSSQLIAHWKCIMAFMHHGYLFLSIGVPICSGISNQSTKRERGRWRKRAIRRAILWSCFRVSEWIDPGKCRENLRVATLW